MAVNGDRESNLARRYLLGQATEEERAAIEQEYFADGSALEGMETAEENLIEDYLAGRLTRDERTSFERSYLTVPHRRMRVETIRGLMDAAQRVPQAPRRRSVPTTQWLSLAAAALLILALGGWWVLRTQFRESDTPPPRAATSPAPAPATVTPPAPRVFAMSISPVTVRSAGASSRLVIPAETDVVRLHLEGDASQARVQEARARVRTVSGTEVWRGPAELSSDAPPGTIAQIDLPAGRLPPDDYVIELFETSAAGAEQERARYFLAVRSR